MEALLDPWGSACLIFFTVVPFSNYSEAVHPSRWISGTRFHEAIAVYEYIGILESQMYKDAQVDQPGSATIWWWVVLSNAPRNRCGEIKCAHKCCLARPIIVLASQSHKKEKEKKKTPLKSTCQAASFGVV